jgi:hypothetical protein
VFGVARGFFVFVTLLASMSGLFALGMKMAVISSCLSR